MLTKYLKRSSKAVNWSCITRSCRLSSQSLGWICLTHSVSHCSNLRKNRLKRVIICCVNYLLDKMSEIERENRLLLEKIANIMLVNGQSTSTISSDFNNSITLGQPSVQELSVMYNSKSIDQHTPRKLVMNRLEKDAIKIFNQNQVNNKYLRCNSEIEIV